jgi:hypothetical protein
VHDYANYNWTLGFWSFYGLINIMKIPQKNKSKPLAITQNQVLQTKVS